MKNNTTVDTFINTLIDQRGYQDAAPEIREEIYKDLKLRIDEFIMTRTVAQFTDEELTAYETLLDEGKSPEELRQFAVDHIPDYSDFLTGTMLSFQDSYLS